MSLSVASRSLQRVHWVLGGICLHLECQGLGVWYCQGGGVSSVCGVPLGVVACFNFHLPDGLSEWLG